MAVVVVALLVAHSLRGASAVVCSSVVGGGSSFSQVAPVLLAACKGCGGTTYTKSTALDAVLKFNSGDYCVGIGDQPMTVVQENDPSGVAKRFGKLTLPLAVSSYGFFAGTTTSQIIKVTWKDTYNIYSNPKKRKWALYAKGVLSGNIIPYARATGGGVNAILKKLWKAGSNGKIVVTPFDETQFSFPGLSFYTSVQAICAAGAAQPGSISYAQVNICLLPGLREIAVQNAAGQYIQASSGGAVTKQAVPRIVSTLSRKASWASIDTVFQIGKQTPPLVSMFFAFIRIKGLASQGKNAKLAKAVAAYFNAQTGIVGPKYGLDPLLPIIIKKNAAALKLVK